MISGGRPWTRLAAQIVMVIGVSVAVPAFSFASSVATAPPSERARPTATPPTDQQILSAFGRDDYVGALRLIAEALQHRPTDFVLHYNAACAMALLERPDDAIRSLRQAVRHGFRDFDLMVEDPDLESLRSDRRFIEIAEGRRSARVSTAEQAERQQKLWRQRFGDERYTYEYDDELRVYFAMALDEESRERMRAMLRRQGRQQIETLFGAAPADPVFVAIPLPADARTYFRELGDRDAVLDSPNIAGVYEHRPRRLVSSDIGSPLRHEFTHALHYGHMERLRQPHPLWIQEGLATLYEEYNLSDDGTIVFLPNQRHNVMRTIIRAQRVLGWRELAEMDGREFMRQAQQLYPHVRSIFEFLADRGLLEAWYKRYTDGFSDDPTGIAAIEDVFGAALDNIEREWRQWVMRRPAVVTAVRYGGPSLGVEIDDTNDGARILRVRAGGGAARAGLRRGDVIVSVDDQQVASSAELVAQVARRRVGDTLRIRIRREGEYIDGTVRLEALRPDG